MGLPFLLSFSMSPVTISIFWFKFLRIFVMVALKSLPVHLTFVSTDHVLLSSPVRLSCFAAV